MLSELLNCQETDLQIASYRKGCILTEKFSIWLAHYFDEKRQSSVSCTNFTQEIFFFHHLTYWVKSMFKLLA